MPVFHRWDPDDATTEKERRHRAWDGSPDTLEKEASLMSSSSGDLPQRALIIEGAGALVPQVGFLASPTMVIPAGVVAPGKILVL